MPQPPVAGRRSRSHPQMRCRVPVSAGRARRRPGLTVPPQAFTPLRPTGGEVPSRLRAAFTSRSRTRPHASQVNVRSASVRLGFRHPHAEHVLRTWVPAVSHDEPPAVPGGSCRPSIRRACPNPWSATARARRRLRGYPGHVQVFRHDGLMPGGRGQPWPCAGHRPGRSPRGHGCGRAGPRSFAGSRCPWPLRECARLARRSLRSDAPQRLRPGCGDDAPRVVDPGQQRLDAEVDADHRPGPGMGRPGVARSTSTVNDTNHR